MKKIISLVLALVLVASLSVVSLAAVNLYDREGAVYLFDHNGTHTPVTIDATTVAGQYLDVDKPFVSIHTNIPGMGDSIGKITVKIYNWAGDYDSTVGTTPIYDKQFVDLKDCAWGEFDAPEGQAFPAGEYLVTFSNGVDGVGVWRCDFDNLKTEIFQTSYLNGEEVKGCYITSVFYAEGGEGTVDVNNPTVDPGNTPTTPSTPTKVVPKDSENIIMYVDSNTSYVKGKATTLDVAPTVISGRTLVPVRFVSENLGATVDYIEETQTVMIEKDDIVIALVIGEAAIRVSGEYQPLDVPAMTINDRTVIPIRIVAEALGQQVNYFEDGGKGLIVIGPKANSFAASMANAFIDTYK